MELEACFFLEGVLVDARYAHIASTKTPRPKEEEELIELRGSAGL